MKDRSISIDLVGEGGGCLFLGKFHPAGLPCWRVNGTCVFLCVCECVRDPARTVPAPCDCGCAEEGLPSTLCDLCRPKVHRDLSTQWHTAWGSAGGVSPPGLSWRGFCTHSSAGLAGGALCVCVGVSGRCLAVSIESVCSEISSACPEPSLLPWLEGAPGSDLPCLCPHPFLCAG